MLNNTEFLNITNRIDKINDIISKMKDISNTLEFIDKHDDITSIYINIEWNTVLNKYKTLESDEFIVLYKEYLNNAYDKLKEELSKYIDIQSNAE